MREKYGTTDVVELTDVERPTPADDEVLVRVRAASVNRADLDGLRPKPAFVRLFIGLRAPRRIPASGWMSPASSSPSEPA